MAGKGRRGRAGSSVPVACYLDTQSEENVAFYRKRGFEVLREAREPVGALPVWFIQRPPCPQ